jgi:hypothetical protein
MDSVPGTETTPEFTSVLNAQHTAFGVIFGMFTDLKESHLELEDKFKDMEVDRANDALKIKELREEVKVRSWGILGQSSAEAVF